MHRRGIAKATHKQNALVQPVRTKRNPSCESKDFRQQTNPTLEQQ